MGRSYGGHRGSYRGISRSRGQHRAAAGSYKSARNYSPSKKSAATWGARGAAAAYGKSRTKAAAASGAYRTTLAHGGTKGQAKAAARGAVAGLSNSHNHLYGRYGASSWGYSRAVSSYSRIVKDAMDQYSHFVNDDSSSMSLDSVSASGVFHASQEIMQKTEKVRGKLDECEEKLTELSTLISSLHGLQLYRARSTETKLLNLIDELKDLLGKLQGLSSPETSSSGISYRSTGPNTRQVKDLSVATSCNDGPAIEYHQLGERDE